MLAESISSKASSSLEDCPGGCTVKRCCTDAAQPNAAGGNANQGEPT